MPTKKIGRYNILERIGKGGMGIVYRALDTVLQREVALKTHTVSDDADMQSVERFFREARVVASFKHKNIVTVYDLGRDGDRVFIAMELLRGRDVTQILEERRHISLEDKVRIVEEVARGLGHAHERGIVHRDIKPRNVFVTEDGEVKLLDFGLAHMSHSTLTEAGQIIGTPFYMSPEQVVGERADPSCDIFSLGTLFYELLTGEKAFTGRNIERIFDAIVTKEPTAIRDIDPTVPEELCRIVSKMMSKSKRRRYQNVEALNADIARFKKFLKRYKTQLRDETRVAFKDLDDLARLHEGVAAQNQIAVPWDRVSRTLDRGDLTYTSLLGLLDGANLQLRRLSRLVLEAQEEQDDHEAETVTMPESPIKKAKKGRGAKARVAEAKKKLDSAQSHFSEGDLASSLLLVSESLRLNPSSEEADALAEEVRLSIVRLVDALDQEPERKHIDVLVAALLAIGEPGGESEVLLSGGGPVQAEISELSDILLAELPQGTPKPKRDESG